MGTFSSAVFQRSSYLDYFAFIEIMHAFIAMRNISFKDLRFLELRLENV